MPSCETEINHVSREAVRFQVAAASNLLIEAKAADSPVQSEAMERLVRLVVNEPMNLEILKELQNNL